MELTFSNFENSMKDEDDFCESTIFLVENAYYFGFNNTQNVALNRHFENSFLSSHLSFFIRG